MILFVKHPKESTEKLIEQPEMSSAELLDIRSTYKKQLYSIQQHQTIQI